MNSKLKESETASSLNHALSCDCGCCGETKEYDDKKNYISNKLVDLIKIILSLTLVITSIFIESFIVSLILCSLSALISGVDLAKKCFFGFKNKNFFNENLLMLIASITAFILGEGFEGALILTLFALGEFLEGAATFFSKKKVEALSKFQTVTVRLVLSSGIENVNPNSVGIGSLIQVNKGEMVPIDGVLLCGSSEFDVKSITGESTFKGLISGDCVYSGYINLGDTVIIKTTKLYDESTVQKIIKILEESLDKKAKTQKFITAFAKKYTPIVCMLAVAVAVIPPLFDSFNFSKWIYKALVMLVISCPCALVISVPLAFFIGIGGFAKRGILVKSSMCVEQLSKIEEVVFDKTGTLTTAEFVLDKIKTFNGYEENNILEYVVSMEKNSTHPIAKSLIKLTNTKLKVEGVKEYPGKGVCGSIDGRSVSVGNYSLMEFANVKVDKENSDALVIYVAVEGKLAAKLYLYDKIKEQANDVVENLSKVGVDKTLVLSGDKESIASRVCDEIGINRYFSELLPDQKVSKLMEEKKSIKGKIMFVGDGINDSPSLSVADIGVAMGGLGSDVAIDVSDVVIMDDDLKKIPLTIKHSKKISKIVRQNIIGSITIKVIITILGILFTLPMGIAMFADVGVMLFAVLNSFRCSRIKDF